MPRRRRGSPWRRSCTRPRSRSSACRPAETSRKGALRSLIVGTAGHVDHGKSALVRALSGTDPDRLKEEKERGITIELGFAHTPLAEDVVASFVDVPGHERFVRQMLAGAHGIDVALLVVAADESVMPQTREHFHICRLLGIPRGLVALTKCDLADAETQALAELEVRELVAGSFLDGRPIVRVSSRSGSGLDALREALVGLARETPPRPADGLLRLPLDRVFSMKGFGTVVTGTLVGGELRSGDEVELLPAGRRARVRGLHVHGAPAERVTAGTRTAVNLGGTLVSDVARGDVLARPGTLAPTSMVDVAVSLLPGARPLVDGVRVRLHAASAEVLARVRLLDAATLAPGGTALAQLRLEAPVVVGRGDRLVLRSYSPAETIAGARVIDPCPPRRRVADRAFVERLRAAPDARAAAEALVEQADVAGIEAPHLAARVTLPLEELLGLLRGSAAVALLPAEPPLAVAVGALARLGQQALAALAAFHGDQPLEAGMPREQLRLRACAGASPAVFDRVLGDLAAAGAVRLLPDAVALVRHEVRLAPGEEEARALLVERANAAGLAALEIGPLAAETQQDPKLLERVARLLVARRVLVRIGDGLLVGTEPLERMKAAFRLRFPAGAKVEVAALKQMTGLSRKYVIPLLEYLDRERVTRRAGADRIAL